MSRRALARVVDIFLADLSPLRPRYAYFKRLDYFSTECIYSPEGRSSVALQKVGRPGLTL